MTETKLPGWAINKIDSKDTYDALVAASKIGENDLCLIEEAGSGTDISLGLTGASVGDIVKVKAVDASGKPTAWEAAGYTLLSESVGLEEAVAFLEFTNLAGYNDFILTYISPKSTDSSGIMLYINGNQVSTGQGSYFMKSNDTRNGIIKIKCNLPDGHYRLEASAQTINAPYNQDVIYNGDGQMRLGDDGVINSIKIGLTKTTSAIPAQTTFKFYGRYISA